ncbi:MAG: hypothetical protein Q9169_001109 [Polycauliona sp. 2 TL-2023]
MSSPPPTFTGQCHCGLIKYTSSSPPLNLIYCYCTTCRHLSGSPFIAWADIPSSSLHIPSNDSLKTLTSSIAQRTICSECGSNITMQYKCDETTIGIAAGTIDERCFANAGGGGLMKMGVTEHIFLEQKVAWYEIPDDGAKRWGRFLDEYEEKLEEWRKEEKKKQQQQQS